MNTLHDIYGTIINYNGRDYEVVDVDEDYVYISEVQTTRVRAIGIDDFLNCAEFPEEEEIEIGE